MSATGSESANGKPILQAIGLYKHFGGLVAVNDVSLDVFPG